MSEAESRDGVVYTETIVYSPPEQYAADVPYQLAIVDLDSGGRLTARILGKEPQQRAHIGDRVTFVEDRGGVSYYRKANSPGAIGDLSESERVLS
jgi:uncharacterized OB-fold protein